MILSSHSTTPKRQPSSFMASLIYCITPKSTMSNQYQNASIPIGWTSPSNRNLAQRRIIHQEKIVFFHVLLGKKYFGNAFEKSCDSLKVYLLSPHLSSSIPSKDGEISATGIHTRGKIYNPEQLPHLLF